MPLVQFAAQLVSDMPHFTLGSKRRALVALLVLLLPLVGYFAWLYYREWKMKRNFRRYWEGKPRR